MTSNRWQDEDDWSPVRDYKTFRAWFDIEYGSEFLYKREAVACGGLNKFMKAMKKVIPDADLFGDSDTDAYLQRNTDRIRGLSCFPEFVTPEEENVLLQHVDATEWSTELARRVQHYGFKYDYKARRIDETMRIGELPQWLQTLGERLVAHGIFHTPPDQVIVNEYLPGHGISPHIDCQSCFGDTIASLSLLSTCVMNFTEVKTGAAISVFLEPRSVLVLKKDARYLWKHSIAKRKQDVYNGQACVRGRRISLTFRSVQLE